MSARKPRLIIAPRARQDLRSIRLYGLKPWGSAQATSYLATLSDGFSRLQNHPLIGRSRDDLGPGLRSWPIGHHVIYYQRGTDQLEIVRILHQRIDPNQQTMR